MVVCPIHPDAITILGACSGTGMLEVGVMLALEVRGLPCRGVCYVERESCAAAALVARLEATGLHQAPVWDDLATFPGRALCGLVDICVAGLPCLPYSLAGSKRGNKDERSFGADGGGVIAMFLENVIRPVRPALVFCENVPSWVTGGHFRRYGEELCGLGYEIEDPVFLAASDLGANHKRERVFVMAHSHDGPDRLSVRQPRQDEAAGLPDRQGEELGDPAHLRTGSGNGQVHPPRSRRDRSAVTDETLADAGRPIREGAERRSASGDEGSSPRRSTAERHPDLPRYAPARNDFDAWAIVAGVDPSLMPAIESEVSKLADGLAPHADSLRLGGNGVDPLVAAVAFGILFDRIRAREREEALIA